jgi:FkbM family methyltransferase
VEGGPDAAERAMKGATEARAGLFSVRPLPTHAGTCPRCLEPLPAVRVRFPGWRSLLEGDCAACGHRYLQDLPTGHGLVYPTTLDLDTGETFDPAGATWFSSWLRPAWESPDGGPVRFSTTVHQARPEVMLLNCLDAVYGHSVLKLLNAQHELERADGVGLVLLVPASLAPLLPEGVAEVWTVHETALRFDRWLLELEERIASELERFESCLLSPAFPHPHPATYDLDRFLKRVPPERVGDPSIVFSLRDDRLWGRDEKVQRERLARFASRVEKTFPRVGYAAVGVGGRAGLPPAVEDLRSLNPDEELERRWLALLRGADLVVGVHGSNMLLPSGLARATLELLPEPRYGNVFQATLVEQREPMSALFRHRTLYGDPALADVSGERVAAVAVSVLTELDRFDALMAGAAAGESSGEIPLLPASATTAEKASAGVVSRLRTAGWAGVTTRSAAALRTGSSVAREQARRRRVRRRARSARLPAVLTDERGLRFELETREEVETFLLHGGHFERDVIDVALRLLEPGMTAVDVGANIGAFTAAFARAVGPGGHVHAFEPLEEARRRLVRTLELNSLGNVTVSASALSDTVGESNLFSYGPGFESWSTLSPRTIELADRTLEAATSQVVETTTLDDYCESAGITSIDLLKIDVEGAEQRVLDGAVRLLEQARIASVIVEVSDDTLEAFGDRAYRLVEVLERCGLRPHLVEGGSVRPIRIAGEHRRLSNVVALSAAARATIGPGGGE